MSESRGLRLNNPCLVRRGAAWRGLSPEQPDPAFCRFVQPIYGLRAAARILATYRIAHGISTLAAVAARWAPETENDTAAYLRTLRQVSGYSPAQVIDLRDPAVLARVIPGIVRQENGCSPFLMVEFEDAIALALPFIGGEA